MAGLESLSASVSRGYVTIRASSAMIFPGDGQQRIDVNLLDPWLLNEQLAEAHQNSL